MSRFTVDLLSGPVTHTRKPSSDQPGFDVDPEPKLDLKHDFIQLRPGSAAQQDDKIYRSFAFAMA
ncbi:hypothetical protein E4U61_001298 [Claviceps capensis]|nr:hypothetical protein E4U61_001298 [Claviceps capensis]